VQAVASLITLGRPHSALALTSELTIHVGPHTSLFHEEERLPDVPDIQATWQHHTKSTYNVHSKNGQRICLSHEYPSHGSDFRSIGLSQTPAASMSCLLPSFYQYQLRSPRSQTLASRHPLGQIFMAFASGPMALASKVQALVLALALRVALTTFWHGPQTQL